MFPDDVQPVELVPGEAVEPGSQEQGLPGIPGGHYCGGMIFGAGDGASVRGHIIAGADEIRTVLPPELQQMPDIVRLRPVVGVRENDEFSGGGVHACISCRGQSAVGLVDDPDEAGVGSGVAVAEGGTAVGGAVVHQDDLKIPAGLGEDGIHAPAQQGFHVIYGDHKGKHGCTSFQRFSSISSTAFTVFSVEKVVPRMAAWFL